MSDARARACLMKRPSVTLACLSSSADSKAVSWLLGRDGEVAVVVIGDVDELTSKFICSGLGEKRAPSLRNK